jgi:hypothetical protein
VLANHATLSSAAATDPTSTPTRTKPKPKSSKAEATTAATHNDHANAAYTGGTDGAIGIKTTTPHQRFEPEELRLPARSKIDNIQSFSDIGRK